MMLNKKMSTLPHITLTTVADDCVLTMYGDKILNDWHTSHALMPTTRPTPHPECGNFETPRRMDFYTAASGKGIEFQSGGFAVRLYLNAARNEGFKSSFVKATGVGFIEAFNITGPMERVTGRWINDAQSGEEIFVKDDTLQAETHHFARNDVVPAYNAGYHLSRFMNKYWPKENTPS